MIAPHERESLNTLLTQWVAEYGPDVQRTIRRSGVRDTDAEDVMQEAFLKAYQKLRGGQPLPANPRGWLKKIAVNAALDHLRKRTADARRRESIRRSGKVRDACCSFGQHEYQLSLVTLLALLNDHEPFDRSVQAAKMRDIDECTFVQIAALFGVTETMARRWYQQGLERLRRAMGDQGFESLPGPS